MAISKFVLSFLHSCSPRFILSSESLSLQDDKLLLGLELLDFTTTSKQGEMSVTCLF